MKVYCFGEKEKPVFFFFFSFPRDLLSLEGQFWKSNRAVGRIF